MFRRFRALLGLQTIASAVRTCSTNCTMSNYNLNFDNLALRTLPIDVEEGRRQRRVEGACFSLLSPTPVDNPHTVAVSADALRLLDLDVTSDTVDDDEFSEIFSGNEKLTGSQTAAHCYCGHQFGYFSGQLGDGCAMYLGEVMNKRGERWEIQLKGAGKTPYSRSADGRKVLRSSIREFLCSEVMHCLGVPTTRAGSCVTSDTKVIRDIKYDGNPIQERATIVLRIAPTFIRFGSFEIFKPMDSQTGRDGPSHKRKDILDKLLNYTIQTFYPEIWRETTDESDRQDMILKFYEEVVRRTARLVAKWQCIGWCHGVLNTDNMSIMGLTIDFGPYGFMDRFDPGFICNGSDDGGRYSYENQPSVVRWNCVKLAEAIQMSLDMEKSKDAIKVYDDEFDKAYLQGMRNKFGLLKESADDMTLISSFMSTMFETGCDFTNGFRCLYLVTLPGSASYNDSQQLFIDQIVSECADLEVMVKSYKPRIHPGQLAMFMKLIEEQPELVEALTGQMAIIKVEMKRQQKLESLKGMTTAGKVEEDRRLWTEWLHKYTIRLEDEKMGDAADLQALQKQRVKIMNENNPRLILRNYMAQDAIELAEAGDYSGVRNLLQILNKPYDDVPVSTAGSDATSTAAADSSAATSAADAMLTSDLCSLQQKYIQRPGEGNVGLIVT